MKTIYKVELLQFVIYLSVVFLLLLWSAHNMSGKIDFIYTLQYKVTYLNISIPMYGIFSLLHKCNGVKP